MSSRKRKRYNDIKCVFFPDDVKNGLPKVGREPPLSSVSSAKSWEKRGDSFLDTPVIQNLKSSGRKLSDIRRLAQSPALVQTNAVHCNEDPVHIAWSSSDSEHSDDENQKQHLSRVVQQHPQRLGRPTAPIPSYTRALRMLSTDKDDLPVIDTDSDLDESDAEKDSGQQISDCESESFDEKPEDLPLKPSIMTELEISGYVSDGESIDGTVTLSRRDSPLQTGEGSKKSISDWVRSAQAMLQTPQKPQSKMLSKTPEDSAKKKRKFQSGGLAERLNRLQCRQRSAVSFWRHQSISDTSTTVDRPGVLVLEVLEVQEECSMQLAHCEHHRPPGEGHQHSIPLSEVKACMLVLFNRETAAQLTPAPRDIIHIYPPWQSLSIEGFSCDIVLNTHFSQKVYSATKPGNMSIPRGLFSAKRCRPYSLCKTFGLLEECRTTEGINAKHVVASNALCRFGGPGVLTRHCLSLLEAIEGLGQAGCVGQDVEVVVQRVYSIPVSILKPRLPTRFSSGPSAEKGKTRLCVLVQDSYGMFSVVQLDLLPHKDDLQQYCRTWQGRTCLLRGIKVVQRVTRERSTRLFSLIDSLWPPVMPLKDHGNTPSMSSDGKPAGPAPSFCYLLSGQESSVEPTEERIVSPLYLPPKKQNLRDILQSERKTCCLSFVATVLYTRIIQSSDVGQGEVWLVLTDPSLQEEQLERPCRRTVALCVSTSCVLISSVLEALNSPAACHISFRDAIREHGVLLCVEQSVVEMCSVEPESDLKSSARAESLTQPLSEPQAKTLPQPVRLDSLSPEITPNSICSLSGMIVGVDENTSYSWPACNHCGSDNLEMLPERPQNFRCVSCKSVVDKPDTRIQLEVLLSSSLSNCTLKVKLQQKTIMSIINTAALEGTEFPGYNVENVLGKEVGPLAAYVRVVTRKPALWIGLEEICLRGCQSK
ncbi:DNA repair-scaffolding protein isoform X1 [Etheostoma spectabile]|uniref:DNA repair-scaffolding protein isoform X1 n=2 Tax=Etheostoma spectabile TaxID=54343 RepID=UPI0013AEA80C|nr:DNA repair-scaffolding protein isoform X1 [Etheostoma spectabile]